MENKPLLEKSSLLPGRRQSQLTPNEKRSIENTFRELGYIGPLEFRDGPGSRSCFKIVGENGTIFVGADIFPGPAANPNSVLDMMSAAAHEYSHFRRWEAKWEEKEFEHLDEALTSLQATCYSRDKLTGWQIEALVSDAIERLGIHARQALELKKEVALLRTENARVLEELDSLKRSLESPRGKNS